MRGKGIGKTLMQFAEDKIKADNGRLLIIETSSKSSYENTRKFYEAINYELTCRIADFCSPGDDRLTYIKRL